MHFAQEFQEYEFLLMYLNHRPNVLVLISVVGAQLTLNYSGKAIK